MNPIVILTRAQVDLYCNGLVDLVCRWLGQDERRSVRFDQDIDQIERDRVVEFRRQAGSIRGDQMIGNNVAQEIEPEQGHLAQHATFVRNACRKDVVEGGYAVRRDDQQPIPIFINVSHFAASQ